MTTADNPPTYSPLLNWHIGSNRMPTEHTFVLANRIITEGAPDLSHLITLADIRAAIDVCENHDANRIQGWRVGSGPPPERLLEQALSVLKGQTLQGPRWPNPRGDWRVIIDEALTWGALTEQQLTERGITR